MQNTECKVKEAAVILGIGAKDDSCILHFALQSNKNGDLMVAILYYLEYTSISPILFQPETVLPYAVTLMYLALADVETYFVVSV